MGGGVPVKRCQIFPFMYPCKNHLFYEFLQVQRGGDSGEDEIFCHYLILIVLHLQVCDQQKWMDTVTGTHYIWNYIFKMKFPAKVLQVISVNYYRWLEYALMRNEYVKPSMSTVSHTMVHLFSLVIIKFKKKEAKPYH